MATTFRLEHHFPTVSVELFERYLNHPDLIAALAKMPAFRSRDLVEKKDLPNGGVLWRFKVVAGGNVPPAAAKVINEDLLTWFEDTRFVPAEHTLYWTITPMKEKARSILESHGIWKLIPEGQGTRRIIEGHIQVKIPILGKVAESYLASELKRNYDVEPDLQRVFYERMAAQDSSKPK